MSRDNGLGKGLLIGLLTGSVVGSIVALLYAPKSGKELRRDIKDKTDELMGEAEQYIADAKVKAGELINDGKKKSEKLISDARVKVEGLLQDAERALDNAKNMAGDEGDKLKSAFKAGLDAYRNEQKS